MRKILAAVLAATFAFGSPAFAQGTGEKKDHTGTIVKWALVGAGAGFGVGFLLGFRAYDDATYAERKILTSGLVGAAVGGVSGAFLGKSRARASELRLPRAQAASSDPRLGFTLRGPRTEPHRAFRSLFEPPPLACD